MYDEEIKIQACFVSGERVVWVDDEDVPHLAYVHWIGRLPGGPDRDWTVGVEFVST